MDANAITHEVIGAAIRIHSALGPGLLENAYRACLRRELALKKFRFQTEVALPITYLGETTDVGYRIDLLVETSWSLRSKPLPGYCPCTSHSCCLT